jgi:dihydropteroate synthase
MTDPARPPEALALAGGWCWFSQVERLRRGEAPTLLPAEAAPPEVLERLSAPRAPIAGLGFEAPRIMGILNVTPDSFSDGGLFLAPEAAVAQARSMAALGADVVDVGGESTRPGAAEVPVAEEGARVVPVIAAVAGAAGGAPVSVDTRKAAVAEAALAAGARIVNDVSALRFDPAMAAVAARAEGLCLVHAQGAPATMQDAPAYDDVLLDVFDALEARAAAAEAAGIPRARLLVDPGIGFGKTLQHNVSLLRRLSLYHATGCAVLVGASRKRFVGTLGRAPEAAGRVPGSLAVALHAVGQGAQVLRVHDVGETAQALRLGMALGGR